MRSQVNKGLGAIGGGAVLALAAMVAAPNAAHADEASCAALKSASFPHTTILSAEMKPADAAHKMPAFCEVVGVASPVEGSKIGVVFRMPDNWNGKALGLGGGGWAGNVTLFGAAEGLQKGYATLQTDGGHSGTTPFDTSWTISPPGHPSVALVDFSYRAVHETAVIGRAVVARYYGRQPTKRYFQGCSTGGRMAMMEAQRFPDDYDAIVAGAPVYTLQVQTSALIRNMIFGRPGAAFSKDQLVAINAAVLKDCDAADGLKDGIVTDPRACPFDPAELQCAAGQSGDQCLTPPQVAALREIYAGVKASDGRWADYPLSKSGELGWSMFIATTPNPNAGPNAPSAGGIGGLRAAMFDDPNYDVSTFDPVRDEPKVLSTAFAKDYDADDPDLRPFFGHGGKLLLWHGFDDPGPSPIGTLDYYTRVQGVVGPRANDDVRLFLLPGVYHCGGGPGPSKMDLLGTLDAWSEGGPPPEVMVAVKTPGFAGPLEARVQQSGPPMSRPECAYPKLPHYKGAGDPNAAESFECR